VPADPFPVMKSLLASEALAGVIEAAYGLRGVRCQLRSVSMRDAYMVTAGSDRFMLFVYRHGERTAEQIAAEWEFVQYLAERGVPVAPGIRRQDGAWLLNFTAPEGLRYGALTRHAPGQHPRERYSAEAVWQYGRAMAQIHVAAADFPHGGRRPRNDGAFLVAACLAALEAVAADWSLDVRRLRNAAAVLRSRLQALPQEPSVFGMIHGDAIRANAQVGDDGKVTVLDFDLCGLGWLTHDVATFLEVVRGLPEERQASRAFLEGYEGVRPLSDAEKMTLPLFRAVRRFGELGIPAMNLYHWGSAHMSERRLRESLAALDQAMAAL
jgi:Ser/Thr protein kinase RdoA (MazF antagonist)